MTSDPQVLITGAGPTGLVLALCLARRGVSVRIIDRTTEPGTTSRAVAVQSRTLELYHQLGIADAIVANGLIVPGLNLWVRGRQTARVSLEGIGRGISPYSFMLVYPQDRHERFLIAQLARLGVEVERGTELTGFEQRCDGIVATLRLPDGSDATCEARYLAGCDGAKSLVRQLIASGFPGGTYSQVFYVADVNATGPATNGELHIELDDADFLAVFPLKGPGHVRLIGAVKPDALRGERPLGFSDIGSRAMHGLSMTVDAVNWFSTYHVHHRVASPFRDRRAFLVGDAAHIHSPVGGQGMNTGIADAVNLAWKLSAVFQHGAHDELLDTYGAERIAFAERLVATTDRIFTIVTKPGRLARIVRTRLVPIVLPLSTRLDAIRRFIFRAASQTGFGYRKSALSEGRAGTVHGGDRLPWVDLGGGRDNFEPLVSLWWQVHVYGAPAPAVSDACAGSGIPLSAFAWTEAMGHQGLRQDAPYLIRPDGYVALAGDAAGTALRRYLEAHGPAMGITGAS